MTKHTFKFIFPILLAFGSCRSIKPDRPPPSNGPVPPEAISSIHIPVEVPLSYIEEKLNVRPYSKMFQDQEMPMGSGLTASLDVDRNGAIRLTGTGNEFLQAKIPMQVKGNLKIEKRVFGQVLSTDFPFDEAIAPQFSFQPHIGENWDFQVKNLEIDSWGKSLRYNLLGFEIDLDPLIRRQVQRVLDNQLSAANLEQLDFKALAESLWQTLAAYHAIDGGGMRVNISSLPKKIGFHQEIGQDQILRLYVAVEGELAASLGKPLAEPQPTPLPKLSPNPYKDNLLDLTVPVSIPFLELDRLIKRDFEGTPLQLDTKTLLVPSNLKTQAYGDMTLLSMDFEATRKDKKVVRGKMYFAGTPSYDPRTKSINFSKPRFHVKSDDFFSNLAIRLKKGKIQRQMRKVANIPIGGFLENASQSLSEAAHWDLDFADLWIREIKPDITGIYQTQEDIQVYINATGKVEVKIKR